VSPLRLVSRLLIALVMLIAGFFAASVVEATARAATGSTGDLQRAAYVEQVPEASARTLADVEDVICEEHVERYRTSRGGTLQLTDTIDVRVAVENGIEQYSAIHQDGVERASLEEIGAVWSDSEYATFINDARQALGRSHRTVEMLTTLKGRPARVVSFDNDQTASNWDFTVHGRHFQVGFRGEIWVSQETGELLRCRRTADHLDRASGVKSIDWTVDFGSTQVAGKRVSVPESATYDVQFTHTGSSHNAITFTNYCRFAAQSAVRFE
jgi:hypothetical protein